MEACWQREKRVAALLKLGSRRKGGWQNRFDAYAADLVGGANRTSWLSVTGLRYTGGA
jgi:hypothetical protein